MGDDDFGGLDPAVELDGVRVFHGDCREVLRGLPDNSVDSIVTDPPYELGFMGKKWDSTGIAYDVTVWSECLRVLKPGGHVLAFGGSRTWHRLAVAIEDAGFEIRDNIARFYGDPHYCGCEFPEPQMVNWSYGTGEPQAEHGVRSVRDTNISQTLDDENKRREVLQPVMPEQGSSSTIGPKSAQGSKDGKEPGLEGRGDVQATKGELHGGEVRSSARVGEADGAEGRLHHGASSGDGPDVRVSVDSHGGGESQGSQSGEQSSVEPGVVSDERGSQAGRSWPICARCGKPVQPTSSANLAWLMGSGFPKSLDVSKAIDKNNGETGRKFKFTKWMRTVGLTARRIDEITNTNMGGHYLTDKSQPAIPTAELWSVLRPHCGDVPEWVDELVARVEAEREVIGQKMSGIADKNEKGRHTIGASKAVEVDITAPATPEAEKWQGWGTALKPAFEPIVVGRKPLVGTVAENVLEWGTGGLNIDGSRIGYLSESDKDSAKPQGKTLKHKGWDSESWLEETKPVHEQGRWPANVMLDEYTAELLDQQSGISKGDPNPRRNKPANNFGTFATEERVTGGIGDTGGASRFFYVAKASKRDRNEGLDELPDTHPSAVTGRKVGSAGAQNGGYAGMTETPRKNIHPTVKPTQLMRYLIKLVTPPGGTVLDPFTGSGSTGKAALLDGFDFVGAELTEEYLPIIEGRLQWALDNRDEDTLF